MFDEVLERKEAYKTIKDWDYKTVDLKTPKICNFAKSLVHGFCQKIKIFHFIVLRRNGSRKSVWWNSKTKEAYWDYNIMGLKRTPKISILPKGLVQGFLSKP